MWYTRLFRQTASGINSNEEQTPDRTKKHRRKRTSSRNATKHGLTAEHPLTQAEDERYDYLLKELNKEYKPKTITEQILVERVANTQLKIERLNQFERATLEMARRDATNETTILKELDYDKELKETFVVHQIMDDSGNERNVPAPLWKKCTSD